MKRFLSLLSTLAFFLLGTCVLQAQLTQLPHKGKAYYWDTNSSTWVYDANHVYTYNSKGVLTEKLVKDKDTDEDYFKTTYHFDKNGDNVGYTDYRDKNGSLSLEYSTKQDRIFNSKNLEIERRYTAYTQWSQMWVTHTIETMTYDQNDRLQVKLKEVYNGSTYTNDTRSTYTYSGDTMIVMQEEVWRNEQWVNDYLYTYSEWRNLNEVPISYTKQKWNGSAWEDYYRYNAVYDSYGGFVNTAQQWENGSWSDVSIKSEFRDSYGRYAGYKDEVFENNQWRVWYAEEEIHKYDNWKLVETVFREWESSVSSLQNVLKIEYSDFHPYVNISSPVADESWTMYPNPVSSTLSLKLGSNDKYRSLTIQDLSGRNHIYMTIEGDDMSLDLSGLSPGFYILNLYSDNQVSTRKLIKE